MPRSVTSRGLGSSALPYPKRSGFRDFGLIDLPFPLRKLSVSPVGTLTARRGRGAASDLFELSRGVSAFPSVGDQVLVPTPGQIAAIVGARAQDRRVRIGCSPLAANATVMVDPDKLFGRHLAVLGNTGSGKSCTVAGLMRWSIQSAEKAIAEGAADTASQHSVHRPRSQWRIRPSLRGHAWQRSRISTRSRGPSIRPPCLDVEWP